MTKGIETVPSLRDHIFQIWQIVTEARASLEYCFYLYHPKTPEEAKYLRNHPHFNFEKHVFWRMAIIEIAKLVSKSKQTSHHNLYFLFVELQTGKYQ